MDFFCYQSPLSLSCTRFAKEPIALAFDAKGVISFVTLFAPIPFKCAAPDPR